MAFLNIEICWVGVFYWGHLVRLTHTQGVLNARQGLSCGLEISLWSSGFSSSTLTACGLSII